MFTTKNIKYMMLAAAFYLSSSIDVNAGVNCNDLVNESYKVPKGAEAVVVTSAEAVTDTGNPTLPDHCKVTGQIDVDPNDPSYIGFQMRLPVNWNGKFLMHGNGQFAGTLENYDDAGIFPFPSLQGLKAIDPEVPIDSPLFRGYAVGVTDAGHQSVHKSDASWAQSVPGEEEINYAFLGVHLVTVVAKEIIKKHYGNSPNYSYFSGCSNGGREAMWEVTKYPKDYDGVLAGTPFSNFNGWAVKLIDIQQALFPPGQELNDPKVPIVTMLAIQNAVIEKCGDSNGIISDPLRCDFDFTLDAGITDPDQLTALEKLYGSTIIDKKFIYPGFPLGIEMDALAGQLFHPFFLLALPSIFPPPINFPAPNSSYLNAIKFVKFFLKDDLNATLFDLDLENEGKDAMKELKYLSPDKNINRYKRSGKKRNKTMGGKLIMYHGLADGGLSAANSVNEFNKYIKGKKKQKKVDEFARLFLLPNVHHCGLGIGVPNPGDPANDGATLHSLVGDLLTPLEKWVEKGIAPDEIPVKVGEWDPFEGKTISTLTDIVVCPYPKRTVLNSTTGEYECEEADIIEIE
jgi:feruloyl esterase